MQSIEWQECYLDLTLVGGEDALQGPLYRITACCYKTAEPFSPYKSHFVRALKPLNSSELTVLGESARSHLCQFVNFVLFPVNVPFFSLNRHPFCDKLLLVTPLPSLFFLLPSAGR